MRLLVLASLLCVLPCAPASAQDDDEGDDEEEAVALSGVWGGATYLAALRDPLPLELATVLLGAAAEGAERVPIDVDGSLHRRALHEGRELALAGRCAEAIPFFTRAAASTHDDGRAALELARCTRLSGELRSARLLAQLAARRAARSPAIRGAALYELGRAYEAAGRPVAALTAYLESLRVRSSDAVRERAQALEAASPLVVDARRLEASEAAPCEGVPRARCRVEARRSEGGVTYVVTTRLEGEPQLVELEPGRSIDVGTYTRVHTLHVRSGGRWWSDVLGEDWAGDMGFGGTGGGVELTSIELVDAVRGGPPELAVSLRSRDVDYDWCESYWSVWAHTRVYGVDGDGAVLLAGVQTQSAHFVAPGRVSWLEGGESEDGRTLDEEWQSCGWAASPRSAEEWAAAHVEELPPPRFTLQFRDGVMSARGGPPPALERVSDIRELAAAAHVRE